MQLLPRNEKFFDLLLNQAKIVLNASNVIAEGLDGSSLHATAGQVAALELEGDRQARDILIRLHKTFITPIDPEDIHQLTTRLHSVLNHLEAAAYRCDAFEVSDTTTAGLKDIAALVRRCVETLVGAFEMLDGDGLTKPDELMRHCEEVREAEVRTELQVRASIRQLLSTEKDAIAVIKQKEIYELLESAADDCHAVADLMEAIGVKNS